MYFILDENLNVHLWFYSQVHDLTLIGETFLVSRDDVLYIRYGGIIYLRKRNIIFLFVCVYENYVPYLRTVVELIRKKIRKENVCWSRDCEFFVLCLLSYEHMHIVLKP